MSGFIEFIRWRWMPLFAIAGGTLLFVAVIEVVVATMVERTGADREEAVEVVRSKLDEGASTMTANAIDRPKRTTRAATPPANRFAKGVHRPTAAAPPPPTPPPARPPQLMTAPLPLPPAPPPPEEATDEKDSDDDGSEAEEEEEEDGEDEDEEAEGEDEAEGDDDAGEEEEAEEAEDDGAPPTDVTKKLKIAPQIFKYRGLAPNQPR